MTKRVRDSPFLKNVKMHDFVPRGHTQEFEKYGGVGRYQAGRHSILFRR